MEHLKGLTQLEQAASGGNQGDGSRAGHFQGLTQLRSLEMSGTAVTDAGVEKLRKALPNCEITRTAPDDPFAAPAAAGAGGKPAAAPAENPAGAGADPFAAPAGAGAAGKPAAAPALAGAGVTDAGQAKAIAEIEKLGGKVTVDEKSPGKPVIVSRFGEHKVTDAGWYTSKG